MNIPKNVKKIKSAKFEGRSGSTVRINPNNIAGRADNNPPIKGRFHFESLLGVDDSVMKYSFYYSVVGLNVENRIALCRARSKRQFAKFLAWVCAGGVGPSVLRAPSPITKMKIFLVNPAVKLSNFVEDR